MQCMENLHFYVCVCVCVCLFPFRLPYNPFTVRVSKTAGKVSTLFSLPYILIDYLPCNPPPHTCTVPTHTHSPIITAGMDPSMN